jgi:LuxR family maltose regulon positive regulatory protein
MRVRAWLTEPRRGWSSGTSGRCFAAARAQPAAPQGLVEPLTGRGPEVLRLLAAGKSNQRIAHDLFVALDTVKKHVTHVLGKLGAANRTEAVARARQLGLIS